MHEMVRARHGLNTSARIQCITQGMMATAYDHVSCWQQSFDPILGAYALCGRPTFCTHSRSNQLNIEPSCRLFSGGRAHLN